jgi:hypothetical protein
VIEVSANKYVVSLATREHFAHDKGKRKSRIGHLVKLSVVTERPYQIKKPMLPTTTIPAIPAWRAQYDAAIKEDEKAHRQQKHFPARPKGRIRAYPERGMWQAGRPGSGKRR